MTDVDAIILLLGLGYSSVGLLVLHGLGTLRAVRSRVGLAMWRYRAWPRRLA